MGLGVGMGCCPPCNRTCTELTLCGTAETIVTDSDLSMYNLGDVLRRDSGEDGGCWEITNRNVTCTTPEIFTVAESYPKTCATCGESSWSRESGTMTIVPDLGEACTCIDGEYSLPYIGNDTWQYSGSCDIEWQVTLYCAEGAWKANLTLDSVTFTATLDGFGVASFSGLEGICGGSGLAEIAFTMASCEDPGPCEACLADCIPCGESLDEFAQESGRIGWDATEGCPAVALHNTDPVEFPLVDENHWLIDVSGTETSSFEFLCVDGQWVANLTIGGVVFTTFETAYGTLSIPGGTTTASALFQNITPPGCEEYEAGETWQFDFNLTLCGGA